MREVSYCQVRELLDALKVSYSFQGNESGKLSGVCELSHLRDGCLTWVKHRSGLPDADWEGCSGCLFVAPSGEDWAASPLKGKDMIVCENPKSVFSKIVAALFADEEGTKGIAPTSVVEASRIGKDLSVGHHCFIGKDVAIGDSVVIDHNVTITGRVTIGSHTLIHSGVVIGTDGFGYYEEDGLYHKVPHIGGVVIGEMVEIGANTCIDRGTIGDTVIGSHSKIDNLCHIAHNVRIGEACTVIAHAGLGGSAVLGERAYLAPASWVLNQIRVGDGALIGTGAVVTKDVGEYQVVAGVPAKRLRDRRQSAKEKL